jgi:hypothetical protein
MEFGWGGDAGGLLRRGLLSRKNEMGVDSRAGRPLLLPGHIYLDLLHISVYM